MGIASIYRGMSPRRLARWLAVLAVPAALLVLLVFVLRRETVAEERGTTFAVRRGALKITVLEGGSIEALESQDIKSEVKGETKILSIVEEGYMVTQEDVDNKKVLVELDTSKLLEEQISQELEYQNALAANTEAHEEFDIQENQNRSDIRAAELLVKFGRMDLQKYVGAEAASEILAQYLPAAEEPEDVSLAAISPPLAGAPADALPSGGGQWESASAGDGATQMAEALEARMDKPQANARPPIDFGKYVSIEVLGDGEAGQKLRQIENDLVLFQAQVALAQTNLEGTQRLAAKQFVTKTDLETEQLNLQRMSINLEGAQTEKELFIRYEFPKQAEKLLSDHDEAVQKLERARKLAVSKLAQAEAKFKSAEARYRLQAQKRKELQEQIDKCRIVAERTGLVVYGGGEERYWGGEERIEEGASVRERQQIITIPDMKQMSVKVKVHESSIKSIEKGQKATVIVDAYPNEILKGEVVKVGVLPDSRNRWMNPDVKVYETAVSIEGTYGWLKPGLSAQVEILVKELPDVVYAPIQAVAPSNGERVCYVAKLTGTERRVVETGEYNNDFIEIKSGLAEDEDVLLRAPTVMEEAEQKAAAQAKVGEERRGERGKGRPAGDKGERTPSGNEQPTAAPAGEG